MSAEFFMEPSYYHKSDDRDEEFELHNHLRDLEIKEERKKEEREEKFMTKFLYFLIFLFILIISLFM